MQVELLLILRVVMDKTMVNDDRLLLIRVYFFILTSFVLMGCSNEIPELENLNLGDTKLIVIEKLPENTEITHIQARADIDVVISINNIHRLPLLNTADGIALRSPEI